MKKISAFALAFGMLFVGQAWSQTVVKKAERKTESAARATGREAKKVGSKTVHATEEAVDATGKETKKAAKATGREVKKIAKSGDAPKKH